MNQWDSFSSATTIIITIDRLTLILKNFGTSTTFLSVVVPVVPATDASATTQLLPEKADDEEVVTAGGGPLALPWLSVLLET